MKERVEAAAHDEGKKGKRDIVVCRQFKREGEVCSGGFALRGATRPRSDLLRS